jgi:hypothetical protein
MILRLVLVLGLSFGDGVNRESEEINLTTQRYRKIDLSPLPI